MADFKIKGIEDINKAFDGLQKKLTNKILRKESRAGCKELADAAKDRIPDITGEYRGAITVRATKGKRGSIGHRMIVDENKLNLEEHANFYYPGAVESGHDEVPPHPYLRETFVENEERIKQQIINNTLKAVDEYKAGDQ